MIDEYDHVNDFAAADLGAALICRQCGAAVYEVGRRLHNIWHDTVRAELRRLRDTRSTDEP